MLVTNGSDYKWLDQIFGLFKKGRFFKKTGFFKKRPSFRPRSMPEGSGKNEQKCSMGLGWGASGWVDGLGTEKYGPWPLLDWSLRSSAARAGRTFFKVRPNFQIKVVEWSRKFTFAR